MSGELRPAKEIKRIVKTFFGVVSIFFDSGRVTAFIFSIKANKKPEDTMIEARICDVYYDYFETYEEAERFLKLCNVESRF